MSETCFPTAPVAVLQLSDFHFKGKDHPILDRAGAVVAAVRSLVQPVSAIYVVVPGDVAFSGSSAEYALADDFFSDLMETLCRDLPGVEIKLVFAPGNHDCDLRAPSDIRDYTLLKTRLGSVDPNGAIVGNCIAVQDAFFAFASEFGQEHATPADKLAKRFEFVAGGTYRIAFSVYNTAWLSQNPEKPGHLYILQSALISPCSPADIEIVVVHHPYNWLDADNMSAVRAHLESTADVILSGHQHIAVERRSAGLDGNGTYILEAMAMHDPRAAENGFNLIFLSPTEAKWQVNRFVWAKDRYTQIGAQPEWMPFLRNRALEDQGFSNTSHFKAYLSDPGVAFTHGNKRSVFLHDIFVYPELHQLELQRKIQKGGSSSARIRSKDVLQWVNDNKRVLIVGDDKAGLHSRRRSIATCSGISASSRSF